MKRKEAKALGLKKYNTGRPCKNGHLADRRTDNAACFECEKARKATPEYKAKFKQYIKGYHKEYYQREDVREKRQAYMHEYMKTYNKKNCAEC